MSKHCFLTFHPLHTLHISVQLLQNNHAVQHFLLQFHFEIPYWNFVHAQTSHQLLTLQPSSLSTYPSALKFLGRNTSPSLFLKLPLLPLLAPLVSPATPGLFHNPEPRIWLPSPGPGHFLPAMTVHTTRPDILRLSHVSDSSSSPHSRSTSTSPSHLTRALAFLFSLLSALLYSMQSLEKRKAPPEQYKGIEDNVEIWQKNAANREVNKYFQSKQFCCIFHHVSGCSYEILHLFPLCTNHCHRIPFTRCNHHLPTQHVPETLIYNIEGTPEGFVEKWNYCIYRYCDL